MTTLSPDTVRRIEDAAAALIAAGNPNPTNEQVARLTATGEHLAAQLQDTNAELKESREDGRALQTELLALARHDGKANKLEQTPGPA